jgi:hypothetical protein
VRIPSLTQSTRAAWLSRARRAARLNPRALILCAFAIGCTWRSQAALVAPPTYPYSGFGRLGCYSGGSLSRLPREELSVDATRANGPWLVLDSVSTSELMKAGYRSNDIHDVDHRSGMIVETQDRADRSIGGTWMRVAPDSLAFTDNYFPSATYRWKVLPNELRGEAVLVHDVITSDGSTSVSRWPVVLVRVPCTIVPIRHRAERN